VFEKTMLIAILNHCQLLGLLTFVLYKRGVELTEFDIWRFDCTGCFKKVVPPPKKIFSFRLSLFLREILQVCWQFISTYINHFL